MVSPTRGKSMEERQRLFLALVLGGGLFALLGAAFGAVVGAVTWTSGRAAGTALGLAVARLYARASEKPLSRGVQGMIVGGVDGFVFLGVVGILLAAVGAAYGRPRWEMVHPTGTAAAALAAGAVFFGLLAFGMVKGGV